MPQIARNCKMGIVGITSIGDHETKNLAIPSSAVSIRPNLIYGFSENMKMKEEESRSKKFTVNRLL